jgi:PKD repeat protein
MNTINKKNLYTFSFLFLFTAMFALAQRGKDGAKVIGAANTNVNEYTTLTANAAAGVTSITVANSALNTSGYFAAPLAPGDLVMLIQIQGATITFPDDSTYGTISNYNNCGNNELQEVLSVPNGTTITLSCGLLKSYTAAGRVEVIRVPRYTTLTINNGGTLTCPAWNGATGGVLAVEVLGVTTVNAGGTISVSSKGFRGGVLDNTSQFGTGNFVWNTAISGAEKGESIAGFQTDYDAMGGRYDKGAPANGGGGGNGHNGGGGGGGNGGNPAAWRGTGNPSLAVAAWANAWNLEWAGFAATTSSGGGRGGYTYSQTNNNPYTLPPDNTTWSGDYRRKNGGLGGRALDYSTGRLFLAGGGGAGDENQGFGGAGGAGGGLAYVMAFDNITGAGTVVSNGTNGGNTTGANGTDGAGGAGAGGTIILNSTGTVSGITVNANGGSGGVQTLQTLITDEAEGPGAGGGGGYIAVSNGAPARTATGGTNGTTNSDGVDPFTPNGATMGGDGTANAAVTNFIITSTNVTICSGATASLTVTATGVVPGGITYNWYNSATGGTLVGTGNPFVTPSLTVNTTYWVSSCPGFYRIPVTVTIDVLTANIAATNNCFGSPTSFTGTATSSGGTINQWSWDFGDLGTSNIQNPTHTYATAGTFNVVLTVFDNLGCQFSVTLPVTITSGPNVNFASNITTGCAPLTVAFTNSTIGATTYTWYFGDAGTSNAATPTHTYLNPGTYTVILVANPGSACEGRDTIVNMITVSAPPTASFTAAAVCLGTATAFNNTSSGGTTYSWNFGDLGTSALQNPTHTYATANTFNVTLITTAAGAGCSDTVVQTVTVNPTPNVSFTSNITSGCGPLTVTFTNNTTGGTPTYNWNFGDAGTSTSTNPSHTYNTPGTYTVILTATLGTCTNADTIVNMITVSPTPTASFTANTVCVGTATAFNNTSVGGTTYAWDFGDLGTSALQNPTHMYASANTYTVTLITGNGTCSDTATQTITVSAAPNVSFSSNITSGCGPLTVTFNNTTTGTTPTYTWNFGDGIGTSSQTNPIYTYNNPGTYTVTLNAAIGTCVDADSIVNMITVLATPVATFNSSSTSICLGDTIQFTNSSTGGTSYTWDFGDAIGTSSSQNTSYIYTSANTFTVTMIVSNGTCSDTATQSVTVTAVPSISFTSNINSGCASLTIDFINNSTNGTNYSWTFGDGGTSNAATPSHTYTTAGTYTVTLMATNGICSSTDSIVNMITVGSVSSASFTSNDVCLGDPVTINNTSTGGSTWLWYFGNGDSSTVQTPFYFYPAAGTYTITLTVNPGTSCSSTTQTTVNIRPSPDVFFIASSISGCDSLTVTFTNTTTGAIMYSWDFGDSDTSNVFSPTHTYTSPGTYSVALIATGANGCQTARQEINMIRIYETPVITFSSSDQSLCANGCVNFTASATGIPTAWSWSFPGATTATSSSQNPVNICYPTAGTYSVTLNVSNAHCTGTHTLTNYIVVNAAAPALFTQSGDTLTAVSGTAYQWYLNSVVISGATNQQYVATVSGNYSVAVTDMNGCSATSQPVLIIIGIEELEKQPLIYIYPNPVSGELGFMAQLFSNEDLKVCVEDVVGQIIYRNKYLNTGNKITSRIDVSQLAAGVYFISFSVNDKRVVRRFIKE